MRPAERNVSGPVTSNSPTKATTPKKQPAKEKPAPKKTEKKTEAAAPKPKVEPSKPKKPNNKPVVVEKDKKKTQKPPPVPKEVIEELEEAFAKIEEKREKVYSSSKLDVPRLATPAQTEPIFSGGIGGFDEPSYQETLVAYLHQSLHLPEYGEVKIQLSLNKDGTVSKLTVLKSESSKNKVYLEKNLILLKFPRLEKDETFVFTFCNEIE